MPIEPSDGKGEEKLVVLGRIVGAFGIGGWVKVDSFTNPPKNILKYASWRLDLRGQLHVRKHLESRVTAKGVQVRIDGIADRTEAERWRGAEIKVARSELPPPKPGEHYWDDLIGLQAQAPNGAALGEIVDIRESPAHPMLLLRESQPSGESVERPVERLVPLVPKFLKSVDLERRIATLDWYPDW